MSLMVGQEFPRIPVPAVLPSGEIVDEFKWWEGAESRYTVIFFYPLDFTFVCPTEIVAFDKAVPAFLEQECRLIGGSVDSVFSHHAWRSTPLAKGGIGEVGFPLISDLQRKLSDELGILNAGGVTYRAAYLLDSQGVIRHMVVNDLPLGRSVSEMLRMVDALRFHEENGEVCPANWHRGDEAIAATQDSVSNYLARHGQEPLHA